MLTKDCTLSHSKEHNIEKIFLGIDNSQNKNAEVEVHKCVNCKRIWIWYLIETEWHSNASKWFLGEITQEQLDSLNINNVIDLLESLPSITYGGSFFNGMISQGVSSFFSFYAREK